MFAKSIGIKLLSSTTVVVMHGGKFIAIYANSSSYSINFDPSPVTYQSLPIQIFHLLQFVATFVLLFYK